MKYALTLVSLLLVGAMIVFAPYLRAVYQKQTTQPENSIVVTAPPLDPAEEALNFELEQRLEKKQKEDGYVMETYREYEIYRSADGSIEKEVPTSHLSYLRYEAK
ncbi:hypothetical protein [Ectobacillus ponti]|uniref:Uncharacterized protein n=1 Tax=Ectobacillus ponti TaxID=2961894 RepID=A0AA42BR83_9BACI|nr:hypothetical protein [Ectobacillus ponti]MCP8969204.1 hypothetical protein [Ectobacillus ponti]